MPPLLSVSIVSHGNAAEVTSLLESLARHENPARMDLILTGNLGDDLPAVDASPWHSVTLLRNPRPRGFASNHNAAFTHAQGEFFCLLNPDVLFLEPVFERLIARLQSREADLIAPLAVDAQGLVQDSFRALPTPAELFRRRALGRVTVTAIPVKAVHESPLLAPDWIAGFFQLMPARVYADLGGMDERFRLYLEDVDFCTRARPQGLRGAARHDAALPA